MSAETTIGSALIAECDRRLFGECVPRLKKSLADLTDAELWQRPNPQSNSMGNLVLHLCGNVRQWIITTLGGAPDLRHRDEEFSENGPIPKADLFARLDQTMSEARTVILGLDPTRLLELRHVQGWEESILSILVHVVEHFSYHTGQAAYYVKALKGLDLGFYRGVNLNKTGTE